MFLKVKLSSCPNANAINYMRGLKYIEQVSLPINLQLQTKTEKPICFWTNYKHA